MFKQTIFILVLIIFLFSNCTTSNDNILIENSSSNNFERKGNNKIYNSIQKGDLDAADDAYIDLKTSSEDKQLIADAATNLAIAHIAMGENILANFYIQEALQYNPSSEMLRFLLAKNQFLAAAKSSNETTYLQKALDALKTNRSLVSDYDYGILADSMLTRVQLSVALNNQDVSRLYQRLNKADASTFYKEKATILGIDSSEIVRP